MILFLIAQLVSSAPPLSPAEAAAVLARSRSPVNLTAFHLEVDVTRQTPTRTVSIAPLPGPMPAPRAGYELALDRFNRVAADQARAYRHSHAHASSPFPMGRVIVPLPPPGRR